MKKILHLLNSNQFSGAENVVITIIKGSSDKFNHFYCSPIGPISIVLNAKQINFINLKDASFSSLKKVIKHHKPDIIHAHDFRMTILASFFRMKNRIIISHLHNNPPWISFFSFKTLALLVSLMFVNNVVLVSDAIKKEFIFSHLIFNKIKVIGNPTFFSEYPVINVENKKVDLLFVGRLTEQKNPFFFIQISNKLLRFIPRFKSSMVGDGDLTTDIIKYINDKNLQSHIHVHGFQSDVNRFYNESKILYIPSKWEGFGLVAYEALLHGLPVIAHPVGGLPNIVDDTCGLISNDSNKIVTEITKLLMDKTHYKLKSNGAQLKARSLSNKISYFDTLFMIYNKV